MTSSSRNLNLANNDGEYVNERVPDERTPLLKKESARFDDAVPCVAEIDEEAGRVLVDKSVPEQESRNIAGVISILLIGVSMISFFRRGDSFFFCSNAEELWSQSPD